MRKIFTLLILLLLLPATALAAGNAPNSLYVGDQQVISGNNITYWTTNTDGKLTQSAADQSWNVKYDPNTATLTLKNATIKTTHGDSRGAMIYAQSVGSRAVSLTIQLVGENTIVCDSAPYGIYVDAEMSNASYGTDASLTITGNGSLEVSGSSYGIYVKSGTGNASLTIKDASVVASSSSSYDGYAGVCVQSGSDATNSPKLSLAVNGGSLTASGTGSSDGILFYVGVSSATNATTSLTVTDNAIVDARNGGISASRIGETLPTPTPTGDNRSGIVFDGTEGTVYGNVELQEDLKIGEGESLTIGDEAGLIVPNGKTLTNNGTVTTTDGGSLTNQGTINNSGTLPDTISGNQPPKITTTTPLPDGTVGTAYSQSLAADNNPTSWSVTEGDLPDDLSLNSDGTITGTPTTAGQFTFTATATNSAGSDSKEYELTINAPQNIPVNGVTLNPTLLSLFTGGSETLTATVEPSNATNKNVTWATSDDTVVTVQATGNGTAIVTAVGEGTTTITVTTEDGGKKATCTVTVTHSMVHTPKKDATCTEDGNIEYWYCKNCDKYFSDENATEELSDVVIPATGHHYVNGYCTKCGHRDPDYRPDPISYYNIYIEDVCDGVEVTTSKNVVREGGSVSVYVKKDTANYTFDNFHVYYKEGYYDSWDELKEGTQPGEYPIKNIWTHIYIKAQGAEEKEDPTGIESIEGVKVYTKDGSLYVQTPQREQVIIVSMSGVVVKNEEQVGLKQYHGLQPGIYIVRVGDKAYKLRL